MKKSFILLFLWSVQFLFAQADREISYGIFAGAAYSKLSNLPDVIVPKGIYKGYTFTEESKFGPVGGIFINWKYPYANISLQTELSYADQQTDLKYEDIKGLQYTMNVGYSYLNVGAQFKYYPFENFYVGVGPYVGFNISSDKIKYTSNGQELAASSGVYFEPDQTVQKVLQESLTGKNHFFAVFATGYEFNSNLIVSARYSLGISDAMATEENGHRYSENKNKLNSISLVIGYSFDFDDLANF